MSLVQEINLVDIINKSFIIEDYLQITKKSRFIDDLWDFTNNQNERLNSVNDSKLKIDWLSLRKKTPDSIINDMKILSFFYLKCPSAIAKRKNTLSQGYKPNTVVAYIKVFMTFLNSLLEYRTIEMSNGEKVSLIESLSDITLQDIKEVAATVIYDKATINSIRQTLKSLANPIVNKYLSSLIDWTTIDIDNIDFPQKTSRDNISYENKPLPDNYFQFLTKTATIDVISFLKQMDMNIACSIPKNYFNELKSTFGKNTLRPLFDQYVYIREKEREYATNSNYRTSGTSNLKKEFYKEHGVKVSEFYELLNRVHRAALFLLLQFTGVRYSEAASFKVGCLKKIKSDIYVIVGSVIKHKDSNLPLDIDEWVACPVVRDSISILEHFSRFTFNKYILSNTYSVYLNNPESPFSNGGINQALSLYAAEIDIAHKFSELRNDKNGNFRRCVKKEYVISVHRLRHTLALNLVRAKLGIPYISYHLKHVHSVIVAREKISNVTLGYGAISNELFNNSIAVEQAQGELIYDIYHPKSPVEGGINKDEFKKRRKEFFQGLMVNDNDIEDIMEDLKKNGAPFSDVGLGYCGGKKDIFLSDGSKRTPPCVGQLKCNPIQCGNAIIPKSKIPIWIEMYKSNKLKLSDPFLDYAKEQISQFVDESKEVLKYFGVKVDEL